MVGSRVRLAGIAVLAFGLASVGVACDDIQQPTDPDESALADEAPEGSPLNPAPPVSAGPEVGPPMTSGDIGTASEPTISADREGGPVRIDTKLDAQIGPAEGFNKPERPAEDLEPSDLDGSNVWKSTDTGSGWVSAEVGSGGATAESHTSSQDGKNDLLWRNGSTGDNTSWQMDGTTRDGQAGLQSLGSAWKSAGIGDFEQAGIFSSGEMPFEDDIVWWNSNNGDIVSQEMHGRTYTGNDMSIGTVSNTDWELRATGDFSQAGTRDDLLFRNQSTGELVVWHMAWTSCGFLCVSFSKTSQTSLGTVSTDWTLVGVGDFGSGYADEILFHDRSTGGTVLWMMNGTSKASEVTLPTVSTTWQIQTTADHQSDGTDNDIVWRNTSTGRNLVWTMDGAQRVSTTEINKVGALDWNIVGAGELSRREVYMEIFEEPEGGTTTISDNSTMSNTMTVPGAHIVDMDIDTSIEHTYVHDLTITIEHVDQGLSVTLIDQPDESDGSDCSGPYGSGSSGNTNIDYNDEATNSAHGDCSDGTSPDMAWPSLNISPIGALSLFDMHHASGDWKFTVTDNASGDTGTLNHWGLEMTIIQ